MCSPRHGQHDAFACFTLLQYQISLTDGLNNIASVWGGLATAVGAAEKVFQWIDRVPMIIEGGSLAPTVCRGLVEFKDVRAAACA